MAVGAAVGERAELTARARERFKGLRCSYLRRKLDEPSSGFVDLLGLGCPGDLFAGAQIDEADTDDGLAKTLGGSEQVDLRGGFVS